MTGPMESSGETQEEKLRRTGVRTMDVCIPSKYKDFQVSRVSRCERRVALATAWPFSTAALGGASSRIQQGYRHGYQLRALHPAQERAAGQLCRREHNWRH